MATIKQLRSCSLFSFFSLAYTIKVRLSRSSTARIATKACSFHPALSLDSHSICQGLFKLDEYGHDWDFYFLRFVWWMFWEIFCRILFDSFFDIFLEAIIMIIIFLLSWFTFDSSETILRCWVQTQWRRKASAQGINASSAKGGCQHDLPFISMRRSYHHRTLWSQEIESSSAHCQFKQKRHRMLSEQQISEELKNQRKDLPLRKAMLNCFLDITIVFSDFPVWRWVSSKVHRGKIRRRRKPLVERRKQKS